MTENHAEPTARMEPPPMTRPSYREEPGGTPDNAAVGSIAIADTARAAAGEIVHVPAPGRPTLHPLESA
jgi:hypothetical protein